MSINWEARRQQALEWALSENERLAKSNAAFEKSPAGRLFGRLAREVGQVERGYKPVGTAVSPAQDTEIQVKKGVSNEPCIGATVHEERSQHNQRSL